MVRWQRGNLRCERPGVVGMDGTERMERCAVLGRSGLDCSGEEGLGCPPQDTRGLGVGTLKWTVLVAAFGGEAVIGRLLKGIL